MKKIAVFLCGCLLLAGCDQGGDVESSVAEGGPLYTLVDGQDYGYESSTGQVMFYRYLGNYDGEVQLLSKLDDYSVSVIIMKPPYEYFTELGLYKTTVTSKETYRLEPNMLASYMLADALNGNLKRFATDRWDENEEVDAPHYLKVGSDYRPEWLSVEASVSAPR